MMNTPGDWRTYIGESASRARRSCRALVNNRLGTKKAKIER
jgi:hypothetical protein